MHNYTTRSPRLNVSVGLSRGKSLMGIIGSAIINPEAHNEGLAASKDDDDDDDDNSGPREVEQREGKVDADSEQLP